MPFFPPEQTYSEVLIILETQTARGKTTLIVCSYSILSIIDVKKHENELQ